MREHFERLLSPGQWGPMEVRNRLVMPPMGTGMSEPDGSFSAMEIEYYAERAHGGTGLVMTGIVGVDDDLDPLTPGLPRATSDDHVPAMQRLAEAVHAGGAKLAVQLTAGVGRNAFVADPDAPPPSASAVPAFADPSVDCRPVTTEELARLVERFAAAARRAVEAGVDAIDLHGHTGYLIDQFMSEVWNHRDDAYGGDFEGRMRLPVEIVHAVREAVGADVPVSFRLSMAHGFDGGRTLEDGQAIARRLVEAGIDVLEPDLGSYEAMDYVFPPYYLGDAPMVSAAEAARQVVDVPVVAVGNLTPEGAEAVLADGVADFAAIGRGLIADPAWGEKLAAGARERLRPCIRCNQMCIGGHLIGSHTGCAVNPPVGRLGDASAAPASASRRVLVVGGGPAGLEAARVAATRGHEVTLCERDEALGGVIRPASRPEFKRELGALVDWWVTELDALGVDVRLGSQITIDSPELDWADAVIVATGSRPLRLDIPGIDGDHVTAVLAFHERSEPVAGDVVVAGGGLSGCDAALEAAADGARVTIVEMEDDIARDMIPINRITLLGKLAQQGVAVRTGHRLEAIEPGRVLATDKDGQVVKIPADRVIDALGVRPHDTLARTLDDRHRVVTVGDCVEPRKVGEAVHAGFDAAATL